ncbi:MAG: ribosome maturation factor RimP [Clostridia bacterium]|nr:ribosome maturation factor RimP [Clostridia bacterium]
MKKELSGLPARILPVIEPAVLKHGCSVWDIEFVKEGSDRILRITIDTDKEGGIDINDCVAVHRDADVLLDEADPIESSYYLQITSPGLERKLNYPSHLLKYKGAEVSVKLFKLLDGQRKFNAVVAGYDGEKGLALFDCGDRRITPALEDISSVTLIYDYDSDPAFR